MIDHGDNLDRWIDEQLKSPLVEQMESPPPALVRSIADSIARQRRNRRYAAGALAVAAALLVATCWSLPRSSPAVDRPQTTTAVREVVTRAVFVGADDLIAVPVASRYPNVTIVRVYPTYRPDAKAGAGSDGLPATNETIWPEQFNGG